MELKGKVLQCTDNKYNYYELIGKEVTLTGEFVENKKAYYSVEDSSGEEYFIYRKDIILNPTVMEELKCIVNIRRDSVDAYIKSKNPFADTSVDKLTLQREIYSIISFIFNDFQSEREAHDYWHDRMISLGWKYGPVDSPADKIDSALIPYSAISAQKQTEDSIRFVVTRQCLKLVNFVENK